MRRQLAHARHAREELLVLARCSSAPPSPRGESTCCCAAAETAHLRRPGLFPEPAPADQPGRRRLRGPKRKPGGSRLRRGLPDLCSAEDARASRRRTAPSRCGAGQGRRRIKQPCAGRLRHAEHHCVSCRHRAELLLNRLAPPARASGGRSRRLAAAALKLGLKPH